MPLPPIPHFEDRNVEEWAKAISDALQHDLYAPFDDNGGPGVNDSGVQNAIQASVAPLQATLDAALVSLVPVGTIVAYGGATAPTGWLLCQGQQVPKDTYAALYGVLGSTWGAETATHFTLPPSDRVPRGATLAHPVGDVWGADEVDAADVPVAAHTHNYGQASAGSVVVDPGGSPTQSVLIPPITQTPTPTDPNVPAGTLTVTNPSMAVSYIIKS